MEKILLRTQQRALDSNKGKSYGYVMSGQSLILKLITNLKSTMINQTPLFGRRIFPRLCDVRSWLGVVLKRTNVYSSA